MNKKGLTFTKKEKERRRELGLPVTKQLIYMQHQKDGNYKKILVDNYEIVDTYMPSGTHSLVITLETGEKIRILQSFFVEMQSPFYVKKMDKMAKEIV